MNKIIEESEKILEEIILIRRDIHAHPELGNEEHRTSSLIKEKLKEYGADQVIEAAGTGVVGVIKGRKGDGKCIGLRCDMDALPVQENTGLPFSSRVDGVMHACGHDLHVAMMLGNAKILCGRRDQFAGTVKLIFEPSEETQPGGAREILKSGAVDDVDAFLGMHVTPTEGNTGKIAIRKGPVTTSADEVHVHVHGKGGHGSQPHKAMDAILAASQLNVLFQQIQARNTDPLDTCIFTMNTISGGVKINVIADRCDLTGVLRVFTQQARETASEKIHDICRGVEKISGCKIEESVNLGYDACFNDGELVDLICAAYDENLGADSYYIMEEPMMFSEDYSFFSTQTGKPSVLMFLCAGHAENMCVSTLHSEDCTFDESAMAGGMAAMVHAAEAFLGN